MVAILLKRSRLVLLALVVAGAACRGTETAPRPALDRGGELVASLRSEPGNYNRYFEPSTAAELVALLTHGRLVRINRTTDAIEPALAETWDVSPDGLQLTLRLRKDVVFSDGAPFTSADVLFSFAVAYEAPGSVLGPAISAAGKRLSLAAPDPHTVVITFPVPFAPGPRILDNLPVLPRHRLEEAFRAGTIAKAWTPGMTLSDMAGLGPFVLVEHTPGQRMVFGRNPHYWRRAENGDPLPYLDRLTVEIIRDQNAEALRVESGAIDIMSNGDIRPDDYARFKRAATAGRLRLIDAGTGFDPDVLWFNLTPAASRGPRGWLQRREFRQALSRAVDRQALANTVYLGAAVPISGPITPRNTTWHAPGGPHGSYDPAKARQLLASAGLIDRDGDGLLEGPDGAHARFSILLQQGHTTRERTVAFLQDQFRRVGVTVDVVGLDPASMFKRWQAGEYDAILHGFSASSTDPAMNLDFWLSSGSNHVWNPGQKTPATAWERDIDELMRRLVSSADLGERQRLFAEVQRIFGEELPAIHFVAPTVTLALSPDVLNASPAPQSPQVLWSADTLAAAPEF